MKKNSEINIVLLAGGASAERPVSKSSSLGMYKALLDAGYTVTVIDPAYGTYQPNKVEDFFAESDSAPVSSQNYLKALELEIFDRTDLVVLGLHGKWGEDGTIQSLLELKGLKYTGSGVLSCALAMNKGKSKIVFADNGVSVPGGFNILKKDFDLQSATQKIEERFGYPIIIKPNDEGSTFGLTLCEKREQIEEAFNESFKFTNNTLVEEFIAGRELTVGVIDGLILPVLEIKPKHLLYDYECKYTKGMSEYIVPAEIDNSLTELIQKQTELAFNAIDCKGYARVDFRLSNNGTPYCLEVNNLPGMTPTSLLPKMAEKLGISYTDLVQKIVKFSL